jgi:glucokinase
MDVIGVDIGATKVNVIVLDDDGVGGRRWRTHDASTGDDAFTCARRLIAETIDPAQTAGGNPSAIGVAVAGLVDTRSGVLIDGGMLLVKDLPLGRELEERFGVPVVVENDANATLIAALEDHEPSGPEATSLLFALGTGIGGAVAIGRTVLHGSFGFAGELGHLPVAPPGGPRCVCGSTGCLELVASGTAVAQRARDDARQGSAAGLLAASGKPWRELTAVDVVHAAESGERYALDLLESAGDAVGRAIAGLGAALDPEVVFLSGSFGHAAATFIIPAIERRVSAQHTYPKARPLPDIRPDSRGPDAAAIGAALLARSRLEAAADRLEPRQGTMR